MIFPIRGHSYLECDKNTALINNKARCEDWFDVFHNARKRPSPFEVIEVRQDMVRESYHGHWVKAPVLPPQKIQKPINKKGKTAEEKNKEEEDSAKSRILPKEHLQGKTLYEGEFMLPGLAYEEYLRSRIVQEKTLKVHGHMENKGRKYGIWKEEDMERAIASFKNGDMGINAVCRVYGVPKKTLKRHLAETNTYATDSKQMFGRPQDLPAELENELVQHVSD
ncbi:hypothetical protein J6590_101479 [Homalodisca vitripennis]|nr:hypothetical protein J6590_101479 [Homalodisca vitripennis]